jgi:hypothetical protein
MRPLPGSDVGGRGASPRLPGAGSDRLRDLAPGREPGTGAGQMEHDPARRPSDPDGELDQPLAEGGHLRARAGRPLRGLLQRLKEDIRRGRQQDAKLVGQETGQLVRPRPRLSLSSLWRFSTSPRWR